MELGGEEIVTDLLSHRGTHSLDFRTCFGCCHHQVCFIGITWWYRYPTPLPWLLHGSGLSPLPTEKGRGESKLIKLKPAPCPTMLLGWTFICWPLLPHLCRMQAWWLDDVLLCFLPDKDWIVLACHILCGHIWRQDLYQGNQIILKPWGWAPIH